MYGQWWSENITYLVDPGTECEVESIQACLTTILYTPFPPLGLVLKPHKFTFPRDRVYRQQKEPGRPERESNCLHYHKLSPQPTLQHISCTWIWLKIPVDFVSAVDSLYPRNILVSTHHSATALQCHSELFQ